MSDNMGLTLGILVIDYQKSDPKVVIPQGSVDCLIDTTGASMEYLPLIKPKTGAIVTISIIPSGEALQNSSVMRLSPDSQEKAHVPIFIRYLLNFLDYIRRMRASYYGVYYKAIFLEPNGKDLDSIRQWFEEGKLRTVIGTTAHFKDINAVQDACQMVYNSKGGIGKSVILFQ
jgi:NADPH:quinone reductase-like Zn-dependent oxidoreductase